MHEELEAFDEPLGFAVIPGTVPPREAVYLGGQRVGDVWPDGDGWQAQVEDAGSALNVELDSHRAAVAVLVAIFNGHLLPPRQVPGAALGARQVNLLSWRLAAALIRRHPELTLIETHPGGGQYDCLTLLEKRAGQQWRTVVDMNRRGSVHVHPGEDDTESLPNAWRELAAAEDWRGWLGRLEDAAELPPLRMTSLSSRALVVQVLHAVLATAAVADSGWDVRSGMLDASDGSRVREELFEGFPAAREALGRREQHDVFGEPAYRFWFVLRDTEPVVCVEGSGSAWNLGAGVDLPTAYAQAGERLTPVVSALLGDAAP